MNSEKSFGFIEKLVCFVTISTAMVQYKLRKRETSFWYWLYNEVTNQNSGKHNNYWLVQFLLVDAINKDDDAKIAAIPKYLWEAARLEEARTDHLMRIRVAVSRCELPEVVEAIESVLERQKESGRGPGS